MTQAIEPDNKQIDTLWRAFDQGHHAEVVAKLADLEAPPEPAKLLLSLAQLESGDIAAAQQGLQDILRHNPENIVAGLFLVLALYESGEIQGAGSKLRELIPILPHRGFLRRFLELLWPHRAAIFGLSNTTPLPEDPHANVYTQWMEKKGEAPGRNSGLAGKYGALGVKYYMARNPRAAFHFLTRAAELDPDNESYAANAAFSALHCGESLAARDILEPLVEKSIQTAANSKSLPVSPDVISYYAWALHDLGDHQGALRLLALVEPEGPEDCYTHFLASVCWMELGEEEKYREALDHALAYYFIDTWEQILTPFISNAVRWMEAGGVSAP